MDRSGLNPRAHRQLSQHSRLLSCPYQNGTTMEREQLKLLGIFAIFLQARIHCIFLMLSVLSERLIADK